MWYWYLGRWEENSCSCSLFDQCLFFFLVHHAHEITLQQETKIWRRVSWWVNLIENRFFFPFSCDIFAGKRFLFWIWASQWKMVLYFLGVYCGTTGVYNPTQFFLHTKNLVHHLRCFRMSLFSYWFIPELASFSSWASFLLLVFGFSTWDFGTCFFLRFLMPSPLFLLAPLVYKLQLDG